MIGLLFPDVPSVSVSVCLLAVALFVHLTVNGGTVRQENGPGSICDAQGSSCVENFVSCFAFLSSSVSVSWVCVGLDLLS